MIVAREAELQRPELWQYLITPELLKKWCPGLTIEPRLGGFVTYNANTADEALTGDVDVFVEGHSLGIQFRDEKSHLTSSILMSLLTTRTGVQLTVSEAGLSSPERAQELRSTSAQVWTDRLDTLIKLSARSSGTAETELTADAEPEPAAEAAAEAEAATAAPSN